MKPILDRSGRVLAYENDVNEYRREILDRSGGLLGYYNPTIDKTFDRSGRCISNSGDVRASLIPSFKK
jgi:hypothetical protein